MKSKKRFFGFISVLFCFAYFFTGCSSDSEDTETAPQNITLKANKTIFKSDGKESISFSVITDNGDDVSDNAIIAYKSTETTTLSSNTFSTNIPGVYSFYATYNGVTSTEIQVSALPIILEFKANTTTIKSNGKDAVIFNIIADGDDVTENAEILHFFNNNEETLNNNSFTTESAGIHKFYCKYKDQTSDTITITVNSYTLNLSVDTTSIKANGKSSAMFTIMADDEVITNEATIYKKNNGEEDVAIENYSFTTIQEGTYEFYAKYKGQISNTISINAIVSNLVITADKTEIKTGETVFFSALSDNDKDATQSITLHILKENEEETTLEGNSFTASSFGLYSIFATCEDRTSNTIQIKVSPNIITLSVDKNTIISSGKDVATFTVSADGKQISNAEIYLQETKLTGNTFTSEEQGEYTFYAMYDDVKSNNITVNVSLAKFFKQSCAMEVVASWCGYSPQMMEAFEGVHQSYSDHIQIISMHRPKSALESSDINADDFLNNFNTSGIPFGMLDLYLILSRSASSIENSYISVKHTYPATAGIAISSRKTDNSIDVTMKIKVNETNEYAVCAVIVEDNVITTQRYYLNNSMDNAVWKEGFVNNGVATYIMPGTKTYSGKSLGTMQNGNEKTESFSISLSKSVTSSRTINYDNCRVVAYVLKKDGNKLYINNATSCPINGSIDYKYE